MDAAAMPQDSTLHNGMIHATAAVDPSARLGTGVTIGAYSVIGADVEIGDGTVIGAHCTIDGPTRIGRDNHIHGHAAIGGEPQDKKYRGERSELVIGDRNSIREFTTINRGTGDGGGVTRIGNDNWILAYAHIAHDCQVGNHTIFGNGATLGGHVTVEDHVVVGGLAAVHQFCRVGKLSMLGGCSKAVQDVPPFMLVDGNPAETRTINKVGLERNQVSEEVQNALRQAYKILFREGLTISNALTRIEADLPQLPEVRHLVHFARTSSRGISK